MKEQTTDGPRVNIVSVLLHYGARDRIDQLATTWRSMKCPFHEDSTASGSINVVLGLYNCHACHAGGDGIDIIEMQEGLGFEGACEFARKIFAESYQDIPRTAKKGSSSKSRKPRRFISV